MCGLRQNEGGKEKFDLFFIFSSTISSAFLNVTNIFCVIKATVHPAEKFHYAADGEKLRSEMKGFGTDEQAIIAVLTSRSHEQRLAIVNYFTQEYDRELLEELKEELGEKFDDLTYGLIGTNAEQFAYELNSLLENELSEENSLIEILASRSVDEIKEIAKQYAKSKCTIVPHINALIICPKIASSDCFSNRSFNIEMYYLQIYGKHFIISVFIHEPININVYFHSI